MERQWHARRARGRGRAAGASPSFLAALEAQRAAARVPSTGAAAAGESGDAPLQSSASGATATQTAAGGAVGVVLAGRVPRRSRTVTAAVRGGLARHIAIGGAPVSLLCATIEVRGGSPQQRQQQQQCVDWHSDFSMQVLPFCRVQATEVLLGGLLCVARGRVGTVAHLGL